MSGLSRVPQKSEVPRDVWLVTSWFGHRMRSGVSSRLCHTSANVADGRFLLGHVLAINANMRRMCSHGRTEYLGIAWPYEKFNRLCATDRMNA